MSFLRLLLILTVLLTAAQPVTAADLTVVFRYDDCSMRSPIQSECTLLETFRSHGMRVTFALTPFVCAGDGHAIRPQPELPFLHERADFLAPFLRDSTLELALHGLRHQNVLTEGHPRLSDFTGVKYSEFYGLDLEIQAGKIKRGADYLEDMFGVRPTVFTPPWNSYDRNTIAALEECGFTCLSAGARGEAPQSAAMAFLPATCDNTGRLREVVASWRKEGCPEAVLTVMLHAVSFSGTEERRDAALAGLDSTLGWLGAQPAVRVLTVGQAARRLSGVGPVRFSRYNKYRKVWYFLPRVFQTLPLELYLQGGAFSGLTRLGWILCALLYGLPLLLAVLVTVRLARRWSVRRRKTRAQS